MKQLTNKHALIISILLLILISLFVYGRSVDNTLHERLLGIIHDIAEDDAELNQQTLLARSGLIQHYDGLTEALRDMLEEVGSIRSILARSYGRLPSELDAMLGDLNDSLAKKESLIERFKSTNAILRNSLMYFASANMQLVGRIGDDATSRELATALGRLSTLMLQFNSQPSSGVGLQVESLLRDLYRFEIRGKYRDGVRQIVRHGRLIVALTPEVDAYTRSLLHMPISKNVNSVLDKYLAYHSVTQARARKFRWLTFLVSVVLLVYLVYLLRRLQSNAQVLARTNEALAEEKERAEITLRSIGDGVITTDSSGVIQYLNPIAELLTGWNAADARGKRLMGVFNIVERETHEVRADPVQQCLRDQQVVAQDKETLLISRTGEEHLVQITAAPIRTMDSQVLGSVMVFHDVSETQRLIQHISHQAKHDALTGLVNRREFEARLEVAIASAREEGQAHALCYLDLDQFKIVNDTCGHIAGDELLKQISHMLRGQVRKNDTLARLGGDEFGVLLVNCPLDKAQTVAEHLRNTIQEFRFSWQNRIFDVGVSVGLVPITAISRDTMQVMSQADIACYTAKDRGRNRIHTYYEEDVELVRRHNELHRAADIRKALEENRFRLYCQPIVATDAAPGRAAQRCEVLVRLLDDDGRIVPPGAFIPAAERFDLMAVVDRWVIDSTFSCLAKRCSSEGDGAASPKLSINLSGNSISDDMLLNHIRTSQQRHGVEASSICFEITETAAISNLNQAVELITELRKSGFRFALDDFGSGLSSFAYLKTLPVDFLKIDGNFVRDIAHDPIDRAMVEAINQVGHVMGIRTIAEFVEKPETLSILRQIGVDYAQGYGIAMPQPLEQFLRQIDGRALTESGGRAVRHPL